MKFFLACLAATLFIAAPPQTANAESNLPPTYKLVTKQIASGKFIAVRYMPRTGAAWLLADQKWRTIEDKKPVDTGKYVVEVVGLVGDWGAARMDQETGRSWILNQGAWLEISE